MLCCFRKHVHLACCVAPSGHCLYFHFMFLLIMSGREERAAVLGIENPAFDGGGSTELSVPPFQPGREIRGDRPDSTLAAHKKKMELQAPAKERGEASFFISLKFVDSRCVPDLTFLSLPPLFLSHSPLSLSLFGGPWVPAFQSKRVLTSNPRRTSSSTGERYSSGCSISI